MYCKHCGKQLDDDSRFCTYCGGLLNVAVQSTTPQVVNTAEPLYVRTNKEQRSAQYDETFRRNESLTGLGVFLFLAFIFYSIYRNNADAELDADEVRRNYIIACIAALLLRVIVAGVVSEYARKLNRNAGAWGIFAFLLPSISLIVIGQKKKYTIKN